MLLEYLVEISLALDFEGPKVKHFHEDFYESEEYKSFETKVNNKLEEALKNIFNLEKIKHFCGVLEADNTKEGSYTFGFSFYIIGYTEVSFKKSKFKLSKSNANKIELSIKELIQSKIEQLQEIYLDIYTEEIDVENWEEVD